MTRPAAGHRATWLRSDRFLARSVAQPVNRFLHIEASSGLLLVAVGFLGEYTWRILDEVRGAPPFLEGRSEQVAAQPGEET